MSNPTLEIVKIPDHPGYGASADGSIWSKWQPCGRGWTKGKVWRLLKPSRHSCGYQRVTSCTGIKKRTVYVHRLVLAAFRGPCPAGLEVHHIDGDRANNQLSNLEYVSRSENNSPARKIGPSKAGRSHNGVSVPTAKLTDYIVTECRRLYREGTSIKVLAIWAGVTRWAMSEAINGKTWKHIPLSDDEALKCRT